jgi:hypothetical protein
VLGRSYFGYKCCIVKQPIPIPANRLDLLEGVVNHKRLFFGSAWASYDTARPGGFHLVPAYHRIANLRSDSEETTAMIFGVYPECDKIIEGLTALERRGNTM